MDYNQVVILIQIVVQVDRLGKEVVDNLGAEMIDLVDIAGPVGIAIVEVDTDLMVSIQVVEKTAAGRLPPVGQMVLVSKRRSLPLEGLHMELEEGRMASQPMQNLSQ